MFHHRNMAVNGLFPGLTTTRSVSNLGTFETVVIIQPVVSNGGGGYVPVRRGQRPDRYKVTVRVSYDGKTHEDSVIVDDIEARVQAELHGITEFNETEVMISINGIQVNKSNPIITITK